jgi:hypothetical protein
MTVIADRTLKWQLHVLMFLCCVVSFTKNGNAHLVLGSKVGMLEIKRLDKKFNKRLFDSIVDLLGAQ